MERGDGGENRPIWPPDLANIAFVWFALPRRFQALKSQGIVDDYHRYVSINFYGLLTLLTIAFVSLTLLHHFQALKSQGIVDN